MSQEMPGVVVRYFNAANAHDAAAMAKCWKAGGVEVVPALGLTLIAPDELRRHFEELFAGIPDVTFDIQEFAASDRLVAIRSRMSGSHRGLYNGLAGTGRHFAVDVTDFIRFDGDRIVGNHVVVDALSTVRQLGVLPAPDSRSEAAMRSLFNGVTKLRRAFRRG